jgi:hypothetical protein
VFDPFNDLGAGGFVIVDRKKRIFDDVLYSTKQRAVEHLWDIAHL